MFGGCVVDDVTCVLRIVLWVVYWALCFVCGLLCVVFLFDTHHLLCVVCCMIKMLCVAHVFRSSVSSFVFCEVCWLTCCFVMICCVLCVV